jgi:sulfur-carrier protein adenylyltransferase/sulfurtransferase
MEGGLKSWKEALAEGIPETAQITLASGGSTKDVIALALALEDGTQIFYREVSESFKNESHASVLHDLIKSEEGHKSSLLRLYEESPGGTSDDASIFQQQSGRVMEGGMSVDDAIAWAKEKEIRDILELCITLETNAYDRYLLMMHEIVDPKVRQVFRNLSVDEKQHLEKLTDLFEGLL